MDKPIFSITVTGKDLNIDRDSLSGDFTLDVQMSAASSDKSGCLTINLYPNDNGDEKTQ